MDSVADGAAQRRAANARALAALGAATNGASAIGFLRTIREGTSHTIFTVGYERRTIGDLMDRLRNTGIEVLADIREKPVSRRADFRADALREACAEAGIVYQPWPSLGSTESQRDDLRESGDLAAFHKRFRAHAKRHLMPEIRRLAVEARQRSVAVLCYERAHEDCHRMIVADLVADEIDAGIIAIL